MKKFITPSYTFTPGTPGVGSVDLSGVTDFNIKKLVSIINQTRGVLIYSTASSNLKYTNVSGTIVTLNSDTSSHNSADNLQIIYEDESPLAVDVINSVSVTTTPTAAATDAFGRLRVSEGFTLGDYKHIYGVDPNFRDTLANGGTVTHVANQACARLATGSNPASSAIHQTKQYHNYMPGKSQLIKTTINFYSAVANVTKRTGYFDDLNGIFLEQAGDGTLSFVIRTNTSGSPVDTRRVSQAQWNVNTCDTSIAGTSTDGSNFGKVGSWTLDITKTQIFFIDFQWLGVGRVRCGFVNDGEMIIAHEFYNSNHLPQVYMANPNLPIRCEIKNTGATAGGYFDQICSTVISEGGYIESGIDWSVDSGGTGQAVPTTGYYPVIAIRLKNSFKGYPNRVTVRMGNINIYAENNPVYWELIKLPSLSSITLSSPTWTSVNAESAVEYTILGTSFTGGEAQDTGFVGTSSPGGSAKGTGTSTPNSSSTAKKNFINQNQDSSDSEIYLIACRAINASANVWISVQWREIY
jgi:hypothetical protein